MAILLLLAFQEVPLTMKEAVERALVNNLDLEIARYSPLKAEQDIEASWGTFDWALFTNASHGLTQQPTASALQASLNKSSDATMGIRQITPLGISYELSANTRRTETNLAFATLNSSYSTTLGASVTAPLLRGFGLDARYSTIVLARHNHRISELEFHTTLVSTIASVEQAYWNLVFAIEDLKVKRQTLEVAQTLLRNNQERLTAGLVARIEVTRAEADLAAREEAIITAENAMNNAMDTVRRLIDPAALRGGRDVVIVPTDVPADPGAPLDEVAALATGLERAKALRPELERVGVQQDSAQATRDNAEDGALPKLDLTGNANLLGLATHFDNRLLDSTFDDDTHSWSFALAFELPLGNWSADAAWIRAELELRRLNLELRRLEDQILLELRQAVRSIKSNEKRIDAGRKSVTAARENYEAEEARRRAGDATSFEVLSALKDYTNAQTSELKSRIDYALAQLDLQKASGTLLRERGIVLQDQLRLRQ